MANSSIQLVGLDYPTLRTNLVTFLKSQDKFTDYDFEGSNISVLLDLLSYNTYLNAFYLNMVASEMFMDTAQLKSSVVSHAKELNYLPRSYKSSKALIDLTVTTNDGSRSVTVPFGTEFTTKVGSNNYTFSTAETVVLTSNTNVFTASNLPIYEGQYVSESFVVNYDDANQRFILSNENVDIDSLVVVVYEDQGGNILPYTYASTLFGVEATSQVFFIQPATDGKYEVTFGNGIIGRRPKNESIVSAFYRSASGADPDGSYVFVNNGSIDGHNDVVVTTVTAARGGDVAEDIESIRRFAPRYFQTQERAVTTNDYATLLQTRFSEINAISVYGGEEVDPPQYGRVFIAVDINGADGVPDSNKVIYASYLKDKTPLTINPVFIDPEFMYVSVVSTVKYNVNVTNAITNDIKTAVQSAISNYNTNTLDNFNTSLVFSKFVRMIDEADASIVGNDTTIRAIKTLVPTKVNVAENYTLNFNLPLDVTIEATNANHLGVFRHIITSSLFTFDGTKCILEDDGDGHMWVSSVSGNFHKPVKQVGTVNYQTGKIILTNFEVSAYDGSAIKLYASPASRDIISQKNTILSIRPEDVVVTVIGVKQ